MSIEADLEAARAEINRLNRQVNKLLPAFAVCRDINMLAPICRNKFLKLADRLKDGFRNKETKSKFVVFETYRSPMRQAYLFEHTKNTKAKAWQSAHQYGLAADFVPQDPDGIFSWREEEDWEYLERQALTVGLRVPIVWDRPHVCAPEWHGVYEAMT